MATGTGLPPRHLVVEGPVGVGKTSLVKRLAETFQSELLLEMPEENPFLDTFYRDRRATAFQTQLFFLLQRSRQLDGLEQQDLFSRSLICDFMLEKDALFAEMNLDYHEMELYRQIYDMLCFQSPAPDLVVYLQAPVEVLLQRISKRGRPQERELDPAYLKQLLDTYNTFFAQYSRSPLLIINTAEINPLESDADFQMLVEKICTVKAGKHFFNPGPSLI